MIDISSTKAAEADPDLVALPDLIPLQRFRIVDLEIRFPIKAQDAPERGLLEVLHLPNTPGEPTRQAVFRVSAQGKTRAHLEIEGEKRIELVPGDDGEHT